MADGNVSSFSLPRVELYSGSVYPIFQWVDDLQVWSTFPSASPGNAWQDAPHAPH